jgi:outer membrane protein TolC
MRKYFTAWILCLLFGGSLFGQIANIQKDRSADSNSSSELTILHLIQQVRNAHPLKEVAQLNSDFGSAYLLAKRGAFDPYLVLNTREKNFNGKQYYQGTEGKLTLPTFSPISGEIGYDEWNGTFINPELNTGSNGLQYIGLNISILKGLITDQRRTELRKAKLFNQQSQAEQRLMLSQTACEIWSDYLEWYIAYKEVQALEMGVSLTSQRQIALRELFYSGGCNGMDTLENSIQLNLFKARLQQESVNLFKAKLTVSKHLWSIKNENSINTYSPLEIAESVNPSSVGLVFLDSAFNNSLKSAEIIKNVPYLNVLENKVSQKDLEAVLKKQEILPKLDLKLQTISGGLGSTDFNFNNQRFGVSFSSPLFLRKEIGNYKMAKYEFKQLELEFAFKQNETKLKIQALRFQVNNYKDLLNQYNSIAQGYRNLYEMEKEKFNNGDGTIFLLNTRELRFLDAQIKSIEQEKKYIKSIVEYLNATGEIQYSVF